RLAWMRSASDDRSVGSSPWVQRCDDGPHARGLLAMAMFVLVVDTSLMNVSISAVVHDLGTTVSTVQAAIALTGARPFALQIVLLVPLTAGLLGTITSFRMLRLPDPESSSSAEGMVLG